MHLFTVQMSDFSVHSVCKDDLSNINSGLHENKKMGWLGRGGGGGIMYSKE